MPEFDVLTCKGSVLNAYSIYLERGDEAIGYRRWAIEAMRR